MRPIRGTLHALHWMVLALGALILIALALFAWPWPFTMLLVVVILLIAIFVVSSAKAVRAATRGGFEFPIVLPLAASLGGPGSCPPAARRVLAPLQQRTTPIA